MASPPQRVEESIQFGDFPPDFLANLIKETLDAPKDEEDSKSQPLPIYPQLRCALMRKPTPRILAPPPPSLTPNPSCRFVRVPAGYCCDNRAPSAEALYLSRDPLLKKMYERYAIYRNLSRNDKPVKKMNEEMFAELKGPIVKYWFTFPLNLQTRRQVEPFLFESFRSTAIAWATPPINCCRDQLENFRVRGLQIRGFHWVKIKNPSGTQFRPLREFQSVKDKTIWGYVECRKCGRIFTISYFLHGRFAIVSKNLIKNRNYLEVNGEKVLSKLGFFCLCDGELNPFCPFISKDLNKINWMHLFLGNCLGHCTLAQLQYFCNKRQLGTSGGKNRVMLRICFDICKQLDPEFIVPEDSS